ncbi:PREDICTED: probable methyltransferase PMT19 isoform X2 [Nelumbo nucifera]|uniref:Methyltransferase n=1 Tax=Nelumbo nucifera TaxID=4432 RepID=A0A1U8PZ98_NELNU|nr:PREDICTED: probable methyltransferase PMT19 isoform X2 [Nelumbo nucifera]
MSGQFLMLVVGRGDGHGDSGEMCLQILAVSVKVASFGAALMDFNILTMSIAPRDIHEAQVQFALERGLPAMIGVLSTYRLPFPARSFDMVHCSRCLVQWTGYDGQYLMEIDRILRPGGYWVLSGPPINWKVNYKGWRRLPQDLEEEQASLEDLARRLCWKKIAERGPIAVWRKPSNHVHCTQKLKAWKSLRFCGSDPDAGWYKKMETCITPLPKVRDITDISGGALEKWPKRLTAAPPRIRDGTIGGTTVRNFDQDNQLWNHRVSYYGIILKSLPMGKYRNIMDMNAGFGGFACALSQYPVWVMNVVPFDAKNNTLGVIYDRGLIGTYMNWCEAFSTYPRTYDLIHASGVLSMYMDKCDILDILFEMHRILRPEGAIIIRDHVDVIVKAKSFIDRMRWNSKIAHSEKGPFDPDKVLIVDGSEQ